MDFDEIFKLINKELKDYEIEENGKNENIKFLKKIRDAYIERLVQLQVLKYFNRWRK